MLWSITPVKIILDMIVTLRDRFLTCCLYSWLHENAKMDKSLIKFNMNVNIPREKEKRSCERYNHTELRPRCPLSQTSLCKTLVFFLTVVAIFVESLKKRVILNFCDDNYIWMHCIVAWTRCPQVCVHIFFYYSNVVARIARHFV